MTANPSLASMSNDIRRAREAQRPIMRFAGPAYSRRSRLSSKVGRLESVSIRFGTPADRRHLHAAVATEGKAHAREARNNAMRSHPGGRVGAGGLHDDQPHYRRVRPPSVGGLGTRRSTRSRWASRTQPEAAWRLPCGSVFLTLDEAP